MEDLFTVFVLVLLPVVFGPAVVGTTGFITAVGFAAVKIVVLVIFTCAVGGWLIPRMLTNIANTGSRELFTLAVLAIALSIAVGSAYMFDVSMALGAFLARMVVGRSEFSLRAATEALPLRDAFAVLFFVSVGMLFDWNSLVESPGLVIATLAVILIGKPVVAFLIVVLMRYPLRAALSVALILSQVGEFSFILATMGTDLNILPANASNILVAAAIISITVNPLLYRAARPIERWLNRNAPDLIGRVHARSAPAPGSADQVTPQPGLFTAVIVGYGPGGQTVARLLQENNIDLTIVELNVQTVKRLHSQGFRAIYGDVARIDTLTEAGVKQAGVLVLSASNIRGSSEMVRKARVLNPEIRIIARTAYLSELEDLRDAGVDVIFSDEGEVALSVTELILKQLPVPDGLHILLVACQVPDQHRLLTDDPTPEQQGQGKARQHSVDRSEEQGRAEEHQDCSKVHRMPDEPVHPCRHHPLLPVLLDPDQG